MYKRNAQTLGVLVCSANHVLLDYVVDDLLFSFVKK